MLESILSSSTATVSVGSSLICILAAIILGAIISLTHKFTSKKSNGNFLLTLAVLPVLVQVVIFLVNGNLGTAFAVAGAFSLVRFRSMAGTSKEIVSIFWAMAVGLGLGMGYVVYTAIITVIVAILIFVITKINEKTEDTSEKKLKIVIPENLDYEEVFNDIFENYTSKVELKKAKTTNMGSMYELTYTIKMKKGKKEKEFMDEIRCRNGNMVVAIERADTAEGEL